MSGRRSAALKQSPIFMTLNIPASLKVVFALFLCAASTAGVLRADVALPPVFGDHAVLQQGVPVPVWGTAASGEKVTVTYLGHSQSTAADAAGKWSVKLDPLPPGATGELTVAAANTITLKDVVTGEVWVCSGQSNMELTVRQSRDPKTEIPAANHPGIRMFKAPYKKTVKKAGEPDVVTNEGGTWDVCSPETVPEFSATGYYFGRALHEARKMPIGLINASVGGTPIQAWVTGGGLYRSRVFPVVPYAISGAIWYQGEANARPSPLIASQYDQRLVALIEGWRKDWGYDFPFAWVQLPNYQIRQTEPVEELSLWAPIRESMWKAKRVPHTGMAITIDLGGDDHAGLHPTNKQDVGARLAQWALADVYGDKTAVASGPLMSRYTIKGNEVVIEFTYANGGLVAKDGALKSFAIAGEDHKWVWADARIDGDKVIVSSAAVPAPVAVRYGWAQNPIASLYNGAGLPSSPFRTDTFALSTEDLDPKRPPGGQPGAPAAPVTTKPAHAP